MAGKKKVKHIWGKPPNDKKKVVWSPKQYKDHVSGDNSAKKATKAKSKPRTKKTKTDTNKFTKLVESTLNKMGYTVWRNNTAGVYNTTSAAKAVARFLANPINLFKLKSGIAAYIEAIIKPLLAGHFMQVGGKKGVSDLIGTERGTGRSIYVEIKTGSDKESKTQEEFRIEMVQTGAIAIVFSDQDVNWNEKFPIEKALEEKLKPFRNQPNKNEQ